MAVQVDEDKCTGCGICSEVCPVEAITVDQVVKIDAATCIDCGSCVAECPNGAISMEEMETALSARSSYPPPPSQISTMRDETIPNPPGISGGQSSLKQVNKGGLLGQIFDFFGGPTGQGRGRRKSRGGRGKGRGWRGGRGKGRRNW